MKRLLPQTLTSQTIWVLLIGLSVSHFLSMMIYSGERVETLSMMGGRNMAQRIASVSHLLIEAPKEWRGRIITALNDPTFHVEITPQNILIRQAEESPKINQLKAFLRSEIGLSKETILSVQLIEQMHDDESLSFLNPKRWVHMREMSAMHDMNSHQSLRVSFILADKSWLNFATDIPESDKLWSATSLMSLFSMGLAVVILAVWVVRRITIPLRSFSHAAQRLGRDVNAPPMSEEGPLEVQEAAKAFNEMQGRLQRLVENRTQMLAAVSHDLRTPITVMRLRSELVPDEDDRVKMLSTLDDMEHMISLTLEFAKQDMQDEARCTVDIVALVESICDDLEDGGKNVHFKPCDQILYICAPLGMKRVVSNLIENAIKYAGDAQVSIQSTPSHLDVIVEDNGPGIAENQLQNVLQPFYRCETSRNRDTGGVGLGLSISQSIIEAHGGQLHLENRPEGGLKVIAELPK